MKRLRTNFRHRFLYSQRRWVPHSAGHVHPTRMLTPRQHHEVQQPYHLRQVPMMLASSSLARNAPSYTSPASSAARASQDEMANSSQSYAVIGGGFAGVAVVWHLLKHASVDSPVSVDLYDCEGLGGGGSGAAGGLLHPFTPRGKPLWRGDEGVQAAMELIEAAEEAVDDESEPFVWRSGLLRPAKTAKHGKDFGKFCRTSTSTLGSLSSDLPCNEMPWNSSVVSSSKAQRLVPGLSLTALQLDIEKARGDSAKADNASNDKSGDGIGDLPEAALHVEQGIILNPKRYLRALWMACEKRCRSLGCTSRIQLIKQRIDSLSQLQQADNKDSKAYTAVVVAAGAAVGKISELRDVLPLHLSQGYTLDVVPKEGKPPYPVGSPSLLGNVYMSVQDGGKAAIIGATRNYGLSPEEAMAEIGREVCEDCPEAAAACEDLLSQAEATWPPLSNWKVKRIRTGVRALPPRTAAGSIPLAGRILSPPPLTSGNGNDGLHGNHQDAAAHHAACPCWVVAGLGARGLVYHGLLASWLVDAIRNNDPQLLPSEVTAWQVSTISEGQEEKRSASHSSTT